MAKTKIKIFTVALLVSLLVSAILPVAFADSSGESEGTAEILSATPSFSSPELWNEAEDTDKNHTDLTVNTEYRLNFTIGHASTLTALHNVTIRIWDSGEATENDTNAQIDHYSVTWVESTDTWAVLPAGYIDTGDCEDPGTDSALTSYEFRCAFDLSKVAGHTTTASDTWKISIFVWDDSDNADSEKTLMFDVTFYAEISITDTTHAWSGLSPGDTNEVTDDGDIDITVISNADFDVEAQGNQSALINQYSDEIQIGNITLHKDTEGSSIPLTVSWTDVTGLTGQTAPTDEGSATAVAFILWLDVPNGTPAGDYEYKLEIRITES